jgi:predicted amidohydrolase
MTTPTSTAHSTAPDEVATLTASWRRSLAARRASPRTITTYITAVDQLAAYLAAAGMPTRVSTVLEGRCFVLSANQFARRGDYPADYPIAPADPAAVLIGGGSCIVDPAARVLAGPARDGEAILTADLDLDEIARGTFDLDIVGHYARPDVFRLLVDDRPLAPVTRETDRPPA